MGQKVNPHGLRVGVIKDWDSRWFLGEKNIGDTLVSDYKLRKYLKNKLKLIMKNTTENLSTQDLLDTFKVAQS